MLVEPDGHAWVGNFGFDLYGGAPERPAALIHVAPNGVARVAAEGLRFPNGMVRLDNTLIVAETAAARLTAFDITPDHRLVSRRTWADLPGLPDGIAADPEGGIWVAMPIGGTFQAQTASLFVRAHEGGVISACLTPSWGFKATAVAVGGGALFLAEARGSNPTRTAPGNGRIRRVLLASIR